MDRQPSSRIADEYKALSPQTNYSSDLDLRPGETKRRPSRAGTRSVTTLTAEQLERKRANDREAQRAIRQRTKDHIDNLERRIAELSSSDTSTQLVHALNRVDALEQENAVLRSRMSEPGSAYGSRDGASSPLTQSSSKLASLSSRLTDPHASRLQTMHPSGSQAESWQGSHAGAALSEVSTHSLNQMGPSQTGQGGYGYMLDATTTRAAQYGQQGYGPPDVSQSHASAYAQYQGQQSYLRGSQHHLHSADSPHMMYNVRRPR